MSEQIIAKYKHIAILPDWLFGFTFPIRRRAIQKLQLQPGERVLDPGCGTGPNFPLLLEAVGPSGELIGFDLSPDMVRAAQARIQRQGWRNVTAFEASAEEAQLDGPFDALILFAMHDVFTSEAGLRNILAALRPGGRAVAVGPRLVERGAGKALNPMIHTLFHRMAVSSADLDRPWRLLETHIPTLQFEFHMLGALFIAWGKKP